MARLDRTVVSIRIFGDDLDPDQVTRLLGAAPTASARKGDAGSPSSSDRRAVARTGSWRLTSAERSPGDLSGHLRELFSKTTDDLAIWRDLSRRYSCDVFCGLFMGQGHEGEELDAELMAMLGARGLRLALDIYGPVTA